MNICKAEPDVQKFSIARLTTIAIMDGLVESLVYKYLSEMRLSSPRGGPGFRSLPSGSCTSRRKVRRLEKKARDEAEGVLCDIQALVGITDVLSTTLIDCLQKFLMLHIGSAPGMSCMDRGPLLMGISCHPRTYVVAAKADTEAPRLKVAFVLVFVLGILS